MVATKSSCCSRWAGVRVVLGGILIHLSLGTLFTFGNMNPYITSYMRKYGSAPSLTYIQCSWIYAVASMGQGTAIMFGGMAERLIGPKLTPIIGGLAMSTGVFTTFFAMKHSFGLTIFTYGAVFGLGMGFAYGTPMGCAVRWHPKWKGLVNGLVVAGFGGGAFIFNQVQTAFINPDNLKPDIEVDNERYFSQDSVLDKVPWVFILLGGCYAVMQITGSLLLSNPPNYECNSSAIIVEGPQFQTTRFDEEDKREPERPFPGSDQHVNGPVQQLSEGMNCGHPDDGLSTGHPDDGLSTGYLDEELTTRHQDDGLSTGHSDDRLSTGHLDTELSTGHSNDGLSTGHLFTELTIGHSDNGLSTGHSNDGLSTGHSDDGLSTGHLDKELSTGHSDDGLSTGHSDDGLSTGHLDKELSTGHSDDGLSTGHLDKELSTGHSDDGLSTGHLDKELTTRHPSVVDISVTIATETPDVKVEMVDEVTLRPLEVLRSRHFYFIWLMFVFNGQGILFMSTQYKAYGQTFILDDTFMALVGAFASFFNAGGRIVWGILADRFSFRVSCLIMSAAFTCLMLTLQLSERGGKPLFFIYICLLFGSFSGSYSLFPTATAKCFGRKYLPINYGMVFTSQVVTAPLAVFLSQTLKPLLGWEGMFFLVAGFSFISLILSFLFNAKDKLGNEI